MLIRMAFGWRPDFVDPFGGIRDHPEVPDNYELGGATGRVFISYERHSVELAEVFEAALRKHDLVPWRYEPLPAESPRLVAVSEDSRLEQADVFRRESPALLRRLEATVMRSDACIFLVSERSIKSALCEIEALGAYAVHGRGAASDAPVHVVRMEEGIAAPLFLQSFRSMVYTSGLEETIAQQIADNIGVHRIRRGFIDAASGRKDRRR
jgi:hypothetical protein